jgi:hypothetical protein
MAFNPVVGALVLSVAKITNPNNIPSPKSMGEVNGGKTQGKSARSLSGRQPEDKKPSMKGTPLMETPKVPNLTMIHADLLHYIPTQGCGHFVYKNLSAGVLDTQVEPITVFNIDEYFMAHELTTVAKWAVNIWLHMGTCGRSSHFETESIREYSTYKNSVPTM